MPNSGRCSCAYLCKSWNTHSCSPGPCGRQLWSLILRVGRKSDRRLCALAQVMDWSRGVQQILRLWATGCICGLLVCGGRPGTAPLPRADPECELRAPGPYRERRNSPPAAADSREHPLARGRVPGPFLAGYASVKAMVRLRRAGAGGHNPIRARACLERQPPWVAPEVLVAAGLGLIGQVIWSTWEAK
jgi:hypothetical protein